MKLNEGFEMRSLAGQHIIVPAMAHRFYKRVVGKRGSCLHLADNGKGDLYA